MVYVPPGDGSSGRSFIVDPLKYFSYQPVLHDWCNRPWYVLSCLWGVVHIKEPLLLIGKSSPCSGGSGFPLVYIYIYIFVVYHMSEAIIITVLKCVVNVVK